jgi:hypothetical protein
MESRVWFGSKMANHAWSALLKNSPWAAVIGEVESRLINPLAVAVRGVTGEPGSWLFARVYGGLRDLLTQPHCDLDLFAGGMNPAWLALYGFLRDNGAAYPPEADEVLSLHESLAESCGAWLPCERGCLVADRPRTATIDKRGRFHDDDGPAVVFPDGWPLYMVRGVNVSEATVMRPDALTLELIDKEGSLHARHIMIVRFGWDRYLSDSDAQEVDADTDEDGDRRTLMKSGAPETHNERVILVTTDAVSGKRRAREAQVSCGTCAEATEYIERHGGRFPAR